MAEAVHQTRLGSIDVRGLSVAFGDNQAPVLAIRDLSFLASPGEFLCIVGTSGCGKSTILNVLAGFIPPDSGDILVDSEPVRLPGPDRGMVFQRHALFPWKTVMGNVAFGLKMKGLRRGKRRKAAQRYIDLVGLTGFEKRYPAELSGGMEQRVGLARALALEPRVLLMDEPFGSLDAQTRMMMQELLLGIWEKSDCTVVFVTHDVDEAVLLADRIIVLTARPGRVKATIPVSLPRPRAYEMVTSMEYLEIKRQILALIREEAFSAVADRPIKG
jgi:NitT/TauT family transport system ATP-binding protein